jgi:hypothetical protein
VIARNDSPTASLWAELAAPLPPDAINWRQDGRPIARDGRFIARFVAFIDAQFVRERFDAVVPGEWDLTLEPLANRVAFSGEEEAEPYAFKARLQVLGVIRESVGQGKDYKTAETDAFKRAAVRFGIGAELYSFGQNWVQLDGDGKFAKPVEDPAVAYARRHGQSGGQEAARPTSASAPATTGSPAPSTTPAASSPVSTNGASNGTVKGASGDEESCPKCGGRMWDNRLTKKNPKAPDFKCRDRSCEGVIWPPKGEKREADAVAADGRPEFVDDSHDEIPF